MKYRNEKQFKLSDLDQIKDYINYYHIITSMNCIGLKSALTGTIKGQRKKLIRLEKYLARYNINIIYGVKNHIAITRFVPEAGQSIYYLFDKNIFTVDQAEKIAEKIDIEVNGPFAN